MRIIAIRLHQEKHAIKIQLEKVQPQSESSSDHYYGMQDSELEKFNAHLKTYFGDVMSPPCFGVTRNTFYARSKRDDEYLNSYEVVTMTGDAPKDPGQLLKLLIAIDRYYKPNKHYACDYLLFGKESIASYITPAKRQFGSQDDQLQFALTHYRPIDTMPTLSVAMQGYVAHAKAYNNGSQSQQGSQYPWNASAFFSWLSGDEQQQSDRIHVNENLIAAASYKIETDKMLIAEYLAREFEKLYPMYSFLDAFKLSYADLPSFRRNDIMNEIQTFVDAPKKMLNALTYAMKLELIRPCLGMRAHDNGFYKIGYTELELILDADIVMRQDGRLSIDLQNNKAYQKHYAVGKPNHGGLLREELAFLGNILDFRFSDDTDYDRELIFTPESTALLLKRNIALDYQLQQRHEKKVKIIASIINNNAGQNDSSSSDEKSTPSVSVSSTSATFFAAQSITPAVIAATVPVVDVVGDEVNAATATIGVMKKSQ